MKNIAFDTWKAEYEPAIYEDLGAHCFEHEDENKEEDKECECEFLKTWFTEELDPTSEHYEIEDEESRNAIAENRVWSWNNSGIVSGITDQRTNVLITKKAWTEPTNVTD